MRRMKKKRRARADSARAALDLAKKHHQRTGTAESEDLLIEAYAARIHELLAAGLSAEAEDLSKLVVRRHSAAKAKLDLRRAVVAARKGGLAELVRPLADSGVTAGLRTEIESALENVLTDPSALARCEALPAGHPLRRGASDLVDALSAVTGGPVADEEVALPGISRRSPLAPFKLLVRAIAAFYRGDDETCQKLLGSIAPASAPNRMVPVLRGMIAGRSSDGPGAADLASRVLGARAALRRELEALDLALVKGSRRRVLGSIRAAVKRCGADCPEILDRLRQHVSIRATLLDLPVEETRDALGAPSRKDAYFWRLFARTAEVKESFLQACSLWEEFRVHAIHEGWFPEQGPEAAALYLHMAELLRRFSAHKLEQDRRTFALRFEGYDDYYREQPAEIRAAVQGRSGARRDIYFLYLERILERAAACDPDPRIFQQWLDLVREQDGEWKAADRVALAWHEALPADSRPLLLLVEGAERRKAFKKALGFLEQAERLDGLNPDVRRARVRLLVSTAIRHLKQAKPHLASKDLNALEAAPQVQEGDRPAFLAALRWVCSALAPDQGEAERHGHEVTRLLGSGLAAHVLLAGVGRACGLSDREMPHLPPEPALLSAGELAKAVSISLLLGEEMGLLLRIADRWKSRLLEDCSEGTSELEPLQLRSLALAALRSGDRRLAYAASGAGLVLRGPTEARFLLLRARSLPAFAFRRRRQCLDAAAWLARRQRRMDLLEEVIDFLHGRAEPGRGRSPWYEPLAEPDRSTTREEVDSVIQREIEQRKYPAQPSAEDRYDQCDCPACRRRRGEIEGSDPENLLEIEEMLESGFPAGMLPDILMPLLEEVLGQARPGGSRAGAKKRGRGKKRRGGR